MDSRRLENQNISSFNMGRNIKTCVECGKAFYAPPSSKKVTCSKECQKIHASKTRKGRTFSDESRKKISEKAKKRDMCELQKVGTQAALKSTNSGRFETNVNAIDWHLVSPNGKHYHFHSLNYWLRENGLELFGCEPDSREYNNVRAGLSGAKRAALGKKYPCSTYKGWRVIPTEQEKTV